MNDSAHGGLDSASADDDHYRPKSAIKIDAVFNLRLGEKRTERDSDLKTRPFLRSSALLQQGPIGLKELTQEALMTFHERSVSATANT